MKGCKLYKRSYFCVETTYASPTPAGLGPQDKVGCLLSLTFWTLEKVGCWTIMEKRWMRRDSGWTKARLAVPPQPPPGGPGARQASSCGR